MSKESIQSQLLDNLKTAIVVVDRRHRIRYINPAAEALLEVSGSRVLGEAIELVFHEEEQTFTNMLNGNGEVSAYTKRETQLTLPSGHQITVDYAVTPLSEDESLGSAVALEIQPLDRLLRISRDEGIITSQQNTRALVRGLAHEIKNPLGGLRGAAQLLAKELPDKQLHDYTNIIIEEADRLRNLVDQMLGPHKLPDLQLTNIHEVLERVRHLMIAETGGTIDLRFDYDPSIPELMGDKEQLIQATLNIVRNAVLALSQHPPADGSQPTIILRTRTLRQFTIGAERHRLVCHISIIDNGPGIPEEIRETLFLPMVSGRPEGTGLGLSISQSIINRHHGLIECDSRAGQTTFSIYLPLELQP